MEATCNYGKNSSFPKLKVAAHTGLTILDCRKEKEDTERLYEFSND